MTDYTLPPAGPLDILPRASRGTAVAMLRTATIDLPLGAADRSTLDHIEADETHVIVVVASLLRRAWAAGLDVGRAEVAVEAAGRRPGGAR